MVEAAEKYKGKINDSLVLTHQFFSAEDEAAAAHITAKNGLESYAYNLRNSLTAADKPKLETAVNDGIKWLEASQEGSKEEQENQRNFQATARQVFFFLGHELLLMFFFQPYRSITLGMRVDLEVTWRRQLPRWCSWWFFWTRERSRRGRVRLYIYIKALDSMHGIYVHTMICFSFICNASFLLFIL